MVVGQGYEVQWDEHAGPLLLSDNLQVGLSCIQKQIVAAAVRSTCTERPTELKKGLLWVSDGG